MRIAIFTDTYWPEINGVVTSVDTVCNGLRKLGHEVFIFAPRYFGRRDPDTHAVRIPSIPFPFKQMKDQRIILPWGGALRTFGKLKIDVIHSQVPGTVGWLAVLVSWLWRVPHVHTYHTHYMEYTHYMPFPRSFSTRAVRWIARHFCGRCQYVIVPSRGMRTVLHTHGVEAPVSPIPTGIDPAARGHARTLEELFRRYQLGPVARVEGKRLLVSVGRLGREKNIRFLIKAVAQIVRRHDVHFLMIGGGPDRGEIQREIHDLSLTDRVTLVGYVDHEDVFSFLESSELFIFASLTETQGLVLLESMFVGTPVVALEGIGVSDLLENNTGGILCPVNMTAFTESVMRMLSDSALLETKRRQALDRARDWSEDNQIIKIVRIYEQAIRDFKEHGLPRHHHRHRF